MLHHMVFSYPMSAECSGRILIYNYVIDVEWALGRTPGKSSCLLLARIIRKSRPTHSFASHHLIQHGHVLWMELAWCSS